MPPPKQNQPKKQAKTTKGRSSPARRAAQNARTFRNVQRRRAKHQLLYPNDKTSLARARRWLNPATLKHY